MTPQTNLRLAREREREKLQLTIYDECGMCETRYF